MSWWDDATHAGLDLATGGAYEVYNQYNNARKKSADEQKAAYQEAGDSSAKLGSEQRDWYGQQGQQALSYFSGGDYAYGNGGTAGDPARGGYDYAAAHGLPSPAANRPISPDQALINQANNRPQQQQQYFDYMKGQAGGLTNQEQLYNERKGGYDPAQAYEDQQATQQINRQLAARGMYNSTGGVRQITDYQANIGAQRSKALADLASGADTSRLGLDQAYGGAAQGASGEESKYFNDLTNNSTNLANDKASVFQHYSDLGGSAYQQGKAAQIEAILAMRNVDPASRQQMVNDILGVGTGAAKVLTA
jgi:hypothetical protein